MPEKTRGGKRTGSGRKKQERVVDGSIARRIKARVKAEELWVFLIATASKKAKETGNTSDLRNALEYLDNRDMGNTMEHSTINHLHDKPLDLNMTLSLGEGMRLAMQKAEERVKSRKH
jgi:hypothetical protein